VDHTKVSAIKDMRPLTTVCDARRFLGTASNYVNFAYHYSRIANPLFKLISKSARLQCTGSSQEAFQRLKSSLCETPVVRHPECSEPFAIFTDTRSCGVDTVLTHDGQPVWFSSRTRPPAEPSTILLRKSALLFCTALTNSNHISMVDQ
jgi:RNase H-like domain found in reverse transcriptase